MHAIKKKMSYLHYKKNIIKYLLYRQDMNRDYSLLYLHVLTRKERKKIYLRSKIISLDYQNNYIGNSNIMSNNVKSFYILIASLSVLNYVDSPTKLFLELYLAKLLNASPKSFFP